MNSGKNAIINFKNKRAGVLKEIIPNRNYVFTYDDNYQGEPISLTLPIKNKVYKFDSFPPFFDGLLPEGVLLENLLRTKKIDKDDYITQLITVGRDTVGAVTIEEYNE